MHNIVLLQNAVECTLYIILSIIQYSQKCAFIVAYFRTVGAVVIGVALIKLLSVLCGIIRRQLQMVPWHVEVISDNDPRVHPIDPHGVCNLYFILVLIVIMKIL